MLFVAVVIAIHYSLYCCACTCCCCSRIWLLISSPHSFEASTSLIHVFRVCELNQCLKFVLPIKTRLSFNEEPVRETTLGLLMVGAWTDQEGQKLDRFGYRLKVFAAGFW